MIRFSRVRSLILCATLLLGPVFAQNVWADNFKGFDNLPEVFQKKAPENVADLKAIEDHVAKVVEKVMPCVVSVRVGAAAGSGVIVTKDGFILTAGHVSGAPNRDVTVYFHDGKKAKGKTLGGNHGIDSGLIKITTDGEWNCLDMGDSGELKTNQWCMVCAHPGGFKVGRTPPVRLGRISRVTGSTLWTDCVLVGGDSGGPLFDMKGRVIGINSRIGQGLDNNMHVPVNPFKDSWEKLAAGEVFGGKLGGIGGLPGPGPGKSQPFLGLGCDPDAKGCVIAQIVTGSPAEKAGLKADDVIVKFAGKAVETPMALTTLVRASKPGVRVMLEVMRGDETINITVEIGKR